jgi:polysaccharide export outer membrane protein
MRNRLLVLVLVWGSWACASRNLVYFSDISEADMYSVRFSEMVQPKIQRDDLLRIVVSSASEESNILFNVGVMETGADARLTQAQRALNEGYLVDEEGEINFPVLGKVKLEGLTKTQAIDLLTERVSEYVVDPIVNIRFINFKITVIGEVNRPSTLVVPTEKVSLLEALGLAGDMTMYGKRENVLIIRETEGERKATRVNLNSKEFLDSPYYYLQQNDVVYVEPDRIKAIQASTNQRSLTVIGITTSLMLALIFNLRIYLERN